NHVYSDRKVYDAKSFPRPRIVTLCGSSRFFEQFQRANFEETRAGRIVLSLGFHHHRPDVTGESVPVTPEEKLMLDELHLRKIDLSNEILVINVNDYIGASTRREIWYAQATSKMVRFLFPTRYTPSMIERMFPSWTSWVLARNEAAYQNA